MRHDAIVLAGGAGRRMGGVSKADLPIGGQRLLDIVLAAVTGAERIVVVGRVEVPGGVLLTCEDPPGQGPAAGAGAGLAALDASPVGGGGPNWTLLLAVDLPAAVGVVRQLRAAAGSAPSEVDGYCLQDPDGRTQWLAGMHRSVPLRAALQESAPLDGIGLKSVLGRLRLGHIRADRSVTGDIDTWDAYRHWASPPDVTHMGESSRKASRTGPIRPT